MSFLPRWDDDFLTSPLSDPAYSFHPSITYNGGSDRIEIISDSNSRRSLKLLNAINNSGQIIIDLDAFATGSASEQHVFYIRAFGYWFISNRTATSLGFIINEEDFDWFREIVPNNYSGRYVKKYTSSFFSGVSQVKIVKTVTEVSLFLDDVPFATVPSKSYSGCLEIGNRSGLASTFTSYIDRIRVFADSSLSKELVMVEPGISGAIPAFQEIIFNIPEVRLYVDLGSYAPSITGVDNVVYDPGGANISMSEDVGIPDRSGGTNGDFYVEILSNGFADDYRLVFKDEFVLANSVVVTDSVDFDVLPSPSAQTGSLVEEDDIHFFYEAGDLPYIIERLKSLYQDFDIRHSTHNLFADGNNLNIFSGSFNVLSNGIIQSLSQADYLNYSSSTAFPIIIDIDLGKEYLVDNIVAESRELVETFHYTTNFDVYSNTDPFEGNSLAQGTLEASDYPVFFVSLSDISPGNKNLDLPNQPQIGIKARYWRLVITSAVDDTDAGGPLTNPLRAFGEIEFRVNDYQKINSIEDNAQFEHRPAASSSFTTFPAGGVTQADGQVKVILPTNYQLSVGDKKYISFKTKADLSD